MTRLGATRRVPNAENLMALRLDFDMTINHVDYSWQDTEKGNLCVSSFGCNETFHELKTLEPNYKNQIAILLTEIK